MATDDQLPPPLLEEQQPKSFATEAGTFSSSLPPFSVAMYNKKIKSGSGWKQASGKGIR